MKLETFLEKFEQFAEAPDAVAKMRELILQLAVQGKLIPQDPADGDVDLLLRDIAEARSAKGRGKQSGIAPEEQIAESDQWFKVPPSWCWVRLSTVGDIVGGGTPRSDNAAYFAEEGIPWLTPADLNGYKEKRISRGRRCITPIGLANSSAQLLPAGSVLFSSRAPIGYVAIAYTELATNQGFKSCVPFIVETNEFLYYFLKSAAARIDREASGTTFREVSGKIVSQIPVPLPPLAEQKRIVAKVDELMALCDRLETQQQERDTRHATLARASLARFSDAPIPANLNHLFHPSYAIKPADLRNTILKAAFDGVLTGQAAINLLSNADALPSGWVLRDIASMCTIEDGDRGSSYPNKHDFSDSGYCVFLSTKNVRPDGFNFVELEWISKEKHTELRKGTLIRGDVIFTSRGTIGNIAHYDQDVPFDVMRINSGMFILRGFQKHMDPAFLSRLLRSPQIRSQIESLRSGSAQPQLPIREFRKFTAKIPPLAEQRRIVAKVDQLMVLVDQLETQLTASRATATNLMETAVAELTAQE